MSTPTHELLSDLESGRWLLRDTDEDRDALARAITANWTLIRKAPYRGNGTPRRMADAILAVLRKAP